MTVSRVTESGLVPVKYLSDDEIKAHKAEMDEKVLKSQIERAELGDRWAQFDLATRYLNGHGVVQSRKLAIHWFQIAATNGSAQAQEMLSELATNKLTVLPSFH